MANLVSQLPPGVPISSLAVHSRPAPSQPSVKPNHLSPVLNGHGKVTTTPLTGQSVPSQSGQFPSTNSPLDLNHRHSLEVPSTFLPSYYQASFPSQTASVDPSQLLDGSSDQAQAATGDSVQTPANLWTRASQSGPSTRDLFDGIKLPTTIPTHEHTVPTYELPLEVAALAPVPGIKPWTPKPHAWTEAPLFDELHKSSGPGSSPASSTFSYSYNSFPHNQSFAHPSSSAIPSLLLSNTTASSPSSASPRAPGPYRSDLPVSSMSQPQPYSAGYPGILYNGVQLPPSVPMPAWTSPMEHTKVGPVEYAQAIEAYRHIQSALAYIRPNDTPATGPSNNSLQTLLDCSADAQRLLSGRQSFDPMFIVPNMGVTPTTAGYPTPASVTGNGSGSMSVPPASAGMSNNSSGLGKEKLARPANSTHSSAESTKHPRTSTGSDKAGKPATFCRGCGATETPEWRRGPLGPRTLCNACGLVHMKMMRKKKKLEEKASLAAGSGGGSGAGHGAGSSSATRPV